MRESRVETWRRIIRGGDKSWVLFEHGTCVILMRPEPDLAAQATEILRERGPVHAASPAGDFTTITLHDYTGRVVTGHHPYVLNYVAPDEVTGEDPSGLVAGLAGRSKRSWDSEDLQVIHVEDRRV